MTEIIKSLYQRYRTGDFQDKAATLSYYAIFSIAPLLMLLSAIVGFFFESNQLVVSEISSFSSQVFGDQGGAFIIDIFNGLESIEPVLGLSLVGLVLFLYGIVKFFSNLQKSLREIFRVPENNSERLVNKIMISVVYVPFLLFLTALLLLINFVAGLLLSEFLIFFDLNISATLAQIILWIPALVLLALIFALMFKSLVRKILTWPQALYIGLVAGLLFLIWSTLFSVFTGNSYVLNSFGAWWIFPATLLWLFGNAIILLMSAELGYLLSRQKLL